MHGRLLRIRRSLAGSLLHLGLLIPKSVLPFFRPAASSRFLFRRRLLFYGTILARIDIYIFWRRKEGTSRNSCSSRLLLLCSPGRISSRDSCVFIRSREINRVSRCCYPATGRQSITLCVYATRLCQLPPISRDTDIPSPSLYSAGSSPSAGGGWNSRARLWRETGLVLNEAEKSRRETDTCAGKVWGIFLHFDAQSVELVLM